MPGQVISAGLYNGCEAVGAKQFLGDLLRQHEHRALVIMDWQRVRIRPVTAESHR